MGCRKAVGDKCQVGVLLGGAAELLPARFTFNARVAAKDRWIKDRLIETEEGETSVFGLLFVELPFIYLKWRGPPESVSHLTTGSCSCLSMQMRPTNLKESRAVHSEIFI